MEVGSGASRVVASSSSGRVMTPAWMPDGSRLLFAADFPSRSAEASSPRSFQIYSVDLATGRFHQVTAVPGGASSPDVSPDGATLAFVSARSGGYDFFVAPIDTRRWLDVLLDDPAAPAATPGESAPLVDVKDRRYSPWRTLLPRSWTPLADTENGDFRLGLGLAGSDVIGRHAYAVSALWRTAPDHGAPVPAGRPDWSASYSYDRWRPAFFLSASDQTSLLQLAPAEGRPARQAALREQDATAGVAVPIRKVRHTQVFQAAFNAGIDTLSAQGSSFATNQAGGAKRVGVQHGEGIRLVDQLRGRGCRGTDERAGPGGTWRKRKCGRFYRRSARLLASGGGARRPGRARRLRCGVGGPGRPQALPPRRVDARRPAHQLRQRCLPHAARVRRLRVGRFAHRGGHDRVAAAAPPGRAGLGHGPAAPSHDSRDHLRGRRSRVGRGFPAPGPQGRRSAWSAPSTSSPASLSR